MAHATAQKTEIVMVRDDDGSTQMNPSIENRITPSKM